MKPVSHNVDHVCNLIFAYVTMFKTSISKYVDQF